MRAQGRDRRHLLRGAVAAAGAAMLSGCDRLSSNASFVAALNSAEKLSHAAGRLVAPKSAMAQEFSQADVAPVFRGNGTLDPQDADYLALKKEGFASYRLSVGGLVEKPFELSLEQLRALPSRTQITRHDCVEGWSCIGKWKGVPLARCSTRRGRRPRPASSSSAASTRWALPSTAATPATTRASTSRKRTMRRPSSPTS
jgi:DMSO/TMAO reductase YedYZ molybdopterin-dependent catalytic subunit